jgi:hypothetical protein
MMTGPPLLAPEDTTRLSELARACKAAARAVALYPSTHPAIAATLERLADLTSPAALPETLRLTVLPDTLLVDGRAPARADQSINELACLLHEHLVGEMTIHPGGDVDAWRGFLRLLTRTPESVRGDGGIARLWSAAGGQHLELREIDYAEVLRDRGDGLNAAWERVIASCLEGDVFDLPPEAWQALIEIACNAERLGELVAELDRRAAARGGIPDRAAALIRLLRGLIAAVSDAPETLTLVLRSMASAIGQLTPELMLHLLSERADNDDTTPRLIDEIVRRMSDQTMAEFITRNLTIDHSAQERLAQAFHALVPDADRRDHVVNVARDVAARSPVAQTEGFDALWESVAELLRSYSDAQFVSATYGRELSSARARAVDVDRVSDDPPPRIARWIDTVAPNAVRTLDLMLLLDLLRIEADPERWRTLTASVVALVEDLLLVGDFEAADQLVAALAREAAASEAARHGSAAREALDRLARGAALPHIVSHLATIDDAQLARAKSICLAVGEVLIQPLADAVASEERGRVRERLATLLIAFGAAGRRTVDRLRNSANPAVRRTAVQLLRELGGGDSLRDLTVLAADPEPQVQREAFRAILNIGTEAAHQVIVQALVSATPESRAGIMQTLGLARDERAAPLFAHILAHVDHRGPLRAIYTGAIEALGALRDPAAIPPLKTALYSGEWWAPRRTAALRSAAAAALVRIGTPAAVDVLREAAASGSRQLRRVVGPPLARLSGKDAR